MCTKIHNHMTYSLWDTEWDQQNFFLFWVNFCPFTSQQPKNKNFEKIKKEPRNDIILHICMKNDDHIWCMLPEMWSAIDRIFCHFWLFFALLPPWRPRKSKFGENEKTPGDIIILHICTINDSHMMYGFWDIECDRQNFCPFTPLTTLKSKFWKN